MAKKKNNIIYLLIILLITLTIFSNTDVFKIENNEGDVNIDTEYQDRVDSLDSFRSSPMDFIGDSDTARAHRYILGGWETEDFILLSYTLSDNNEIDCLEFIDFEFAKDGFFYTKSCVYSTWGNGYVSTQYFLSIDEVEELMQENGLYK